MINSLDKIGGKKIVGEQLVFENLPPPYWGGILFAKVNIGLEKLIDKKDWLKASAAAGSG